MHKFEDELKSYRNRVKEFDIHLHILIRQKDESHEGNEILRRLWAELVRHDSKYKPDRVNAIIAPNRLAEIAVIGAQIITPPAGSNRPLVLAVADAPYREGDNLVVPTVKSLDRSEASSVIVPVFNPKYGEPYTNSINFTYPITLRLN